MHELECTVFTTMQSARSATVLLAAVELRSIVSTSILYTSKNLQFSQVPFAQADIQTIVAHTKEVSA